MRHVARGGQLPHASVHKRVARFPGPPLLEELEVAAPRNARNLEWATNLEQLRAPRERREAQEVAEVQLGVQARTCGPHLSTALARRAALAVGALKVPGLVHDHPRRDAAKRQPGAQPRSGVDRVVVSVSERLGGPSVVLQLARLHVVPEVVQRRRLPAGPRERLPIIHGRHDGSRGESSRYRITTIFRRVQRRWWPHGRYGENFADGAPLRNPIEFALVQRHLGRVGRVEAEVVDVVHGEAAPEGL
mmetsp:Transcript_94727/g.295081  ORF Transcript_94727/g.295081 Transcript_94727/m.295081 type:complete len:247 (+) Transcript_94727:910-1650(+)